MKITVTRCALAAIMSILNSWHADKVGERYYHALIGQVVAIVGFILSITTTSTAPRYIACFLMYQVNAFLDSELERLTRFQGLLQFRSIVFLGPDIHPSSPTQKGRRSGCCECRLQHRWNVSLN